MARKDSSQDDIGPEDAAPKGGAPESGADSGKGAEGQAGASAQREGSPDALAEALATAEAAARDYHDQLLRTRAEAENQRKRLERQSATALKYAAEKVFRDLLAVADSLELGLQAARQAGADRAVLEGLELTHKQLHDTLSRHGVAVIDPAGEAFDPERHEAVSMVPAPDTAPNHVVDVVQKGYLLHERVLRAARVVVAAAAPAGSGGAAPADKAEPDGAAGPGSQTANGNDSPPERQGGAEG